MTIEDAQAEYDAAVAALKVAMSSGRRYIAEELNTYQEARQKLLAIGGPWLTK